MAARMPLAYVHLVQILVDILVILAPFALYAKLGCQTAVGMPFRDLATADSVVLTDGVPTDAAMVRALSRLGGAGIGVVVPKADLEKEPLEGAIALVDSDDLDSDDEATVVPACAYHTSILSRAALKGRPSASLLLLS